VTILEVLKPKFGQEFYAKCCSSQRLIFTQIEWATAEAEKAIAAKASHLAAERLKPGYKELSESLEEEPTVEEQLLSAILAANGELLEVLKQYEDMERVAIERQAEDRSRKETRINRHVRFLWLLLLNEAHQPSLYRNLTSRQNFIVAPR
jgi:hypothetical protein